MNEDVKELVDEVFSGNVKKNIFDIFNRYNSKTERNQADQVFLKLFENLNNEFNKLDVDKFDRSSLKENVFNYLLNDYRRIVDRKISEKELQTKLMKEQLRTMYDVTILDDDIGMGFPPDGQGIFIDSFSQDLGPLTDDCFTQLKKEDSPLSKFGLLDDYSSYTQYTQANQLYQGYFARSPALIHFFKLCLSQEDANKKQNFVFIHPQFSIKGRKTCFLEECFEALCLLKQTERVIAFQANNNEKIIYLHLNNGVNQKIEIVGSNELTAKEINATIRIIALDKMPHTDLKAGMMLSTGCLGVTGDPIIQ